MRQLIAVLADIHAIDPTVAAVRPFQPYIRDSYGLPKWVTKPAVWGRAIEIFHGPVIAEDRTFIHRDFYPGNVLWFRRRISGVVDWEAASAISVVPVPISPPNRRRAQPVERRLYGREIGRRATEIAPNGPG